MSTYTYENFEPELRSHISVPWKSVASHIFSGSLQASFLAQNWVDTAAIADSRSKGVDTEFKQGLSEQGGDHADELDDSNYGQVTTYDWNSPNTEIDWQRAGPGPSSSLQHKMPYDLDDDDQQIALTLSEFPQVDKEVGGRLTKLESIKVHSIHSVMYDAL